MKYWFTYNFSSNKLVYTFHSNFKKINEKRLIPVQSYILPSKVANFAHNFLTQRKTLTFNSRTVN